jgi:hypothetical protein
MAKSPDTPAAPGYARLAGSAPTAGRGRTSSQTVLVLVGRIERFGRCPLAKGFRSFLGIVDVTNGRIEIPPSMLRLS